jgi:catechol 2,3-dioxygenase-like lactoylglutathione lyase family enzyme
MKNLGWLWLAGGLGLSGFGCGDTASTTKPDAGTSIGETADASPIAAGDAAAQADASIEQAEYLGAAGIGVSDLDASFKFYTEIVGMTLRYELSVPNYADEKILHFENGKGSDVVLMGFTDGIPRNYTKNPVKLVFYVPSASALVEAIRGQGLEVLSEPAAQAAFGGTIVGFARDPDGYILEIIEDTTLQVPYLGAVGLGVSDLARSKDFYTRLLAMHNEGDLLSVPGVWDEWIMKHEAPKGSAVVLLHYTDGSDRNYMNVPVKTVHFVPDVQAVVDALMREGLPILSPPSMFTVQGTNALIALARDPDGYVLELITPM